VVAGLVMFALELLFLVYARFAMVDNERVSWFWNAADVKINIALLLLAFVVEGLALAAGFKLVRAFMAREKLRGVIHAITRGAVFGLTVGVLGLLPATILACSMLFSSTVSPLLVVIQAVVSLCGFVLGSAIIAYFDQRFAKLNASEGAGTDIGSKTITGTPVSQSSPHNEVVPSESAGGTKEHIPAGVAGKKKQMRKRVRHRKRRIRRRRPARRARVRRTKARRTIRPRKSRRPRPASSRRRQRGRKKKA